MHRAWRIALLVTLAVLVASAQVNLKVTQVDQSSGAVTQTTYDPSAASSKAPVRGNYWDSLASTNFFNVPSSVGAPPNPQIGVGADDILTIVNRTIARYPNPNSPSNSTVANPYSNPPSSQAFLDTWLGVTNLNTLCPTSPRNNNTCVISNASIRYDQLQGRFVVLFTVTDIPARISNFALIVSKFATFNNIANVNTGALFTPPTIVPNVGGIPTGGLNGTNWFLYMIPVNVKLGSMDGLLLALPGVDFCNPGTAGAGPITGACSNYFPTDARMGFDNDNIILTAPVLDLSQGTVGTTNFSGNYGPYAGTRVVTLPKLVAYNATSLPLTQPPACLPASCGAVNLADNLLTGTLTGGTGPVSPAPAPGNPIPAIFWEPDNLRGRALASFDAQVGPASSGQDGILSPLDYLVGTQITNSYNTPNSMGNLRYFVQAIVFTCPGTSLFSAPAGVSYCGVSGAGQVPDVSTLGPLHANASTIAVAGDPVLVGQGPYGPTSPPGSGTVASRLFVGDSRPQQVIFREGLLYIARTASVFDSTQNTFGTSTALYNVLSQGAPTAFSASGANIPNPANILETQWFNGTQANPNGYGFYTPMFDVPANVVNNQPTSPITLQSWLEKLFVGMTAGDTTNVSNVFNGNHPSLWDFRPGDDVYDTSLPYLDPYTGATITTVPGTTSTPMVSLSTRGGAATDPNNGSLWVYGAFAKFRLAGVIGPGQWGTSVANYQLDLPASDPYGNGNAYFGDVPATQPFFTAIQIAKNLGIAAGDTALSCAATGGGTNPPITPPPGAGGTGGQTLVTPCFGPGVVVTRSEMAKWIVLAQMDNAQVTAFLAATGGDPTGNATASTFADVLSDPNIRYIEVMARRGYSKGCGFTNDARLMYCPTQPITRAQMSVFIVRAKMSNVFPTSLSGIPLTAPYGDNYGLFQATTPYFTDEPSTDPYFLYIQKMRELRITNGTTTTTYTPGTNLTRQEIAAFIVRAFFL